MPPAQLLPEPARYGFRRRRALAFSYAIADDHNPASPRRRLDCEISLPKAKSVQAMRIAPAIRAAFEKEAVIHQTAFQKGLKSRVALGQKLITNPIKSCGFRDRKTDAKDHFLQAGNQGEKE
jgi:hypothetical protein